MLDNPYPTPTSGAVDTTPVVLPVTPPANASPVADAVADEPGHIEIASDSLAVGVIFALVLTVLTRLVGFVRGILFCKFMTDQQLGQWSMVWSLMMMLAPLAVLGLPGCFGRYTEHYRQRGQMRTFFLRISLISALTTVLMTGFILFAPEKMSWLVFRDPSHSRIMICVGMALFMVTGMNFLVSMMESLRQVRLVTTMRFLLGLVFAVVGCGLMLFWKDAASAAALGYAIACLFASVPACWFLWKNRKSIKDTGEKLPHMKMWRRIAPYALWMWWANMFHNMFEVADRYMLIHWSPVDATMAQSYVGQYHSGRIVPLLLISVSAMLAGVLMPYMSQSWESGKKEAAASLMRWTVKLASVGFTLGGLFVLLGAPILFDWILEGRYNDGLTVLPLTMAYCVWFGMFTLAQEYLWVAEKGKYALLSVGLALLTNIGLNVLLIPPFGLWGAVIATAAGNLLNIVGIYLFNHRFGCKLDLGLWACIGMPLILLLPLNWAVASFACCAVAGCFTALIFSNQEKSELIQVAAGVREKIKAKFGR